MHPWKTDTTIVENMQTLVLRKQTLRKLQFYKLKEKFVTHASKKKLESWTSILSFDHTTLQEKLQERSLTALTVLEAHFYKTIKLTEATNCVTEFVEESFNWAKQLDSLSNPKGPLHGIPFAVKDNFDLQGYDSTSGMAKNLFNPASNDSELVRILKELGAIPFVKTNVAQSLYSSGCDSHIFGPTLNALNSSLSPGGSSGGSGVIVAGGGAVFALASDLGGSLRVPAHFHGLPTLKPTMNRISGEGLRKCAPKIVGVSGVPGIIATSTDFLILLHKAVLQCKSIDSEVVPIPWNEALFSSSQPLRIGYYTSLPFFPTIGDTPTTILAARDALLSAGHCLISVEDRMPNSYRIVELYQSLMWADGGQYFRELFANEELTPSLIPLANAVYGEKSNFADEKSVSKRGEFLAKTANSITTSVQLMGANWERSKMRREFLQMMNEQEIDLVLGPTFPFPAIKPDNVNKLYPVVYNCIYNLMDFPAGVVKFGEESGTRIDSYEDEGDDMLKLAIESAKGSIGMPINVQLAARPFQEELVLRGMSILATN